MIRYYAGIGSRSTPAAELEKMVIIGKLLAERGFILRSGGANGADTAFETGCDQGRGAKEIYLPWKKFNDNQSPLYYDVDPMKSMRKESYDLAAKYHPVWSVLGGPIKLLMGRNGFQVLGKDLQTPCEFVICWTPVAFAPDVNGGGTFQALKIAAERKIPILNLLTDNPKDFFLRYGDAKDVL